MKALFTKLCKFGIVSFLTRPLKYFRISQLPLCLEIIQTSGLQTGFHGAQEFCGDLRVALQEVAGGASREFREHMTLKVMREEKQRPQW